MKQYHKYTKQDDNIILAQIRKSPHNIAAALREATRLINARGGVPVSVKAVEIRWYSKLSIKNANGRSARVCFSLFSKYRGVVNRKNVTSEQAKLPVSPVSQIIRKIKGLLWS